MRRAVGWSDCSIREGGGGGGGGRGGGEFKSIFPWVCFKSNRHAQMLQLFKFIFVQINQQNERRCDAQQPMTERSCPSASIIKCVPRSAHGGMTRIRKRALKFA